MNILQSEHHFISSVPRNDNFLYPVGNTNPETNFEQNLKVVPLEEYQENKSQPPGNNVWLSKFITSFNFEEESLY